LRVRNSSVKCRYPSGAQRHQAKSFTHIHIRSSARRYKKIIGTSNVGRERRDIRGDLNVERNKERQKGKGENKTQKETRKRVGKV